MKRARSFVVYLGALAFAESFVGQQAPVSELDRILFQLQDNRDWYKAHVPDFFCAEHAVSQLYLGKPPVLRQQTISDSIFSLKRSASSGQTALQESRSQMRVNGSPSSRSELRGPVVLANLFARGLDAVAPDQASCSRFSLAPAVPGRADSDVATIYFESTSKPNEASTCVFKEQVLGKIVFDKRAKQTVRIDATIPHHRIAISYYGRWDLSVLYGPVLLGEQSYWLPQQITSTLISTNEDPTIWQFIASYTGCHKYEVRSRILP